MRISKRMLLTSAAATAAVFLLAGVSSAAEMAHDFVGVSKCKVCHKKEEDGAQYTKWMESRHSKAFETLAGEKALEIAKAKGIADPQAAKECLQCHATALPVMADIANQKITMEEGVSCESCHGAGGDYYKKKTMEAITAGEQDGAELGLVMPDEAVCTRCHNDKSPTFEGFDFDAMVKKIAHPRPEAAG